MPRTIRHNIYGRELRTEADCLDLMRELVGRWRGGPPNEDERDVWNRCQEAVEQFRAQSSRVRTAARSGAGTTESVDGAPSRIAHSTRTDEPDDPWSRSQVAVRDAALRSIERIEGLSPAAGDRLVSVVERDRSGADARYLERVASVAYQRAFWKRLSDPMNAPYTMTREESQAMSDALRAESERALTVGSALLPVPASVDPTIMLTSNGATNPLREMASVTSITTSEWNGVSSAGVAFAFTAEATEATDGTPTLVKPVIKPQKAQCWVEYSIEAGQDWGTLQEEMAQIIADAKDVAEATAFTLGDGTDEPVGIVQGVISGATSIITGAGTAVFAVADVYTLQNSLPPRFSALAQWVSTLRVANDSWQFVAAGSTTAAPIWNEDRTRLLGKPWRELSTMDATQTSGNEILLYGDVRAAFKIVDRIGMAIEPVQTVLGANRRPLGVRGLYAYYRVGSHVVNQNAVRLLRVK